MELLGELERLAGRLDIELRPGNGEFNGGICSIHGKKVFIVNTQLTTQQTVQIFCRELSRLDLSGVFVLPAIRQRLEGN